MAVLEERRLQELTVRPTPPDDNFEKKAMIEKGAMEEGDAVFGLNDEINLDSQVFQLAYMRASSLCSSKF